MSASLAVLLIVPAHAQTSSSGTFDASGGNSLCRQAKSGASGAADIPASVGDKAEPIIEYHRAQALQRNAQEPQRAMAHACLYLDKADEAELPLRVADAQRLIAGLLWLRGEPTPALDWIDAAAEGYRLLNDMEKRAIATSLRGSINLDNGDFAGALRDYRRAIAFAEQAGSSETRLQALGNMGLVYSDLNDHESAITYYRRALATQEDEGRDFDAAMTRMNVAYALNGMDKPREALTELNLAEIAMTRQVEGGGEANDRAIAGTALPRLLTSRASTYLEIGDTRQALADLARAEGLISVEANRPELIGVHAIRARVFADLGDDRRAAQEIAKAKSLGDPPTLLLATGLANTEAKVLSALGRFEEAFAASQRASELRDQLREEETLKAAARADVEMEMDDLRRRSQLDEQRATNAELRVQSQQRGLWVAILGIVLLLALLAAMVVAMRNRRMATQALQSNLSLRETLLSEIHHRTKNNLQLLTSLLRVGFRHQGEANNGHEVANRARTMALVHDHLYVDPERASETVPSRPFLEELVELVEQSIGRPNIELSHMIDEVDLSAGQATILGLLGCEMITNAYKHAFDENGGAISLHFVKEGEDLTIRVVDDGRGFEAGQSASSGSIGLQLMRDLASQAGGELVIESKPGSTMISVNGIPHQERIESIS